MASSNISSFYKREQPEKNDMHIYSEYLTRQYLAMQIAVEHVKVFKTKQMVMLKQKAMYM